jgi:hypothetical protein
MSDLPRKRANRPKSAKTNEHALIDYMDGFDKRKVVMAKDALFVMALHATLSNYEVIGWLAGYITEGVTFINLAFPV